jgi:hypothetical protein
VINLAIRAGCNAALFKSNCSYPACQEPMMNCPAQREVRAMKAALQIDRQAAFDKIIAALRHAHKQDAEFPPGAINAVDWLERHRDEALK